MKRICLLAALAVIPAGCGDKKSGPVQVTAEMEAEQKQAEKDVQNAEGARMKELKKQKRELTEEEKVHLAESARGRGR